MNNFLENYKKLEDFKDKLERDYNEKLSQLVGSFIDELNISNVHKKLILEFLDEMKEHSIVTYNHSIDVAFRTYELGQKYTNSQNDKYSLTDKELSELCVAAILHDAGKLDIPKEILEADRKLTDEEFKIMKTHSQKSANHIQRFPKTVIDLAVHHHEKLDGSGYPDKLKGDQISLSNRILTIADITSALFQKRSYKDKFSIDDVINILKNDAQKNQIDSKVTQDMIDIISSQNIGNNNNKNIED